MMCGILLRRGAFCAAFFCPLSLLVVNVLGRASLAGESRQTIADEAAPSRGGDGAAYLRECDSRRF